MNLLLSEATKTSDNELVEGSTPTMIVNVTRILHIYTTSSSRKSVPKVSALCRGELNPLV